MARKATIDRKEVTIQIRFDTRTLQRLDGLAEIDGGNRSQIVRRGVDELPTPAEIEEHDELLDRIAQNFKRIKVIFDEMKGLAAEKRWEDVVEKLDDPTVKLFVDFGETTVSATATLLRRGGAPRRPVGSEVN